MVEVKREKSTAPIVRSTMSDEVVTDVIDVCVVAHTHWDREWYHAAPRFRQRLVALVDALLEVDPRSNRPFLLDGQAVVLEDYLAVRPERIGELAEHLKIGAIEAGPWYVLADGLIPSGEAIVRNLLAGRRVLRRLNAVSPGVAYCPDTFGHPAALPFIASEFGFPVAIVWRGVGGARSPHGDVMQWRTTSGESVIAYHLPPDGYEFGSALPTTLIAAEDRWSNLGALLHDRSNVGLVLVTNGADHHAQQSDLDAAIHALQTAALPDRIMRTSLSNFAKRLQMAVKGKGESVPTITGELRDSYGYTWTLNGTFGTRAAQKRDNARAERALLRDVEPWLVLAWLHGNAMQNRISKDGSISMAQTPALLDVAWRTLLRAQPHDTLCGCSIDAVALAMNVRLASAMTQADGLRRSALPLALNHNAVRARSEPISPQPVVVVRNRSARRRGGVVELVLDETLRDEGVGPPSAVIREAIGATFVKVPKVIGVPLQTGKSKIVSRRRESPQHYPDNDAVRAHYALAFMNAVPALGLSMRTVSFVAEHFAENSVFGVEDPVDRFKDGLPDGMGDDPFNYGRSGMMEFNPSKLHELEDAIELRNDRITIKASSNGITLSLSHYGEVGRTIENVLSFDTTRDEGDSYTPAIRGDAEPLILRSVKPKARGPLRSSVHATWSTAGKRSRIVVNATLILDANSDVVRVDIRGDNQRRNHRLRMNFTTDIAAGDEKQVWADAAFGPVLRKPIVVPLPDQTREMVPATMPMHRWVTTTDNSIGATLHADGLAEVEARDDGVISLTLLRALGQLSRNILPERPGHAGWPADIPLAQSIGKFCARVGLQLHGAWSTQSRDEIEIASDDLLLPLTGETWRDLNDYPRELAGPELQGNGLRWSTVTLADDHDGIVLRCTSDCDVEQNGSWTLPAGDWEFARARLDETLLENWQYAERRIDIMVPPLGALTLRVRRRAH